MSCLFSFYLLLLALFVSNVSCLSANELLAITSLKNNAAISAAIPELSLFNGSCSSLPKYAFACDTNGNVKAIDFSLFGLSSLTSNFHYFEYITFLDLSANYFATLPTYFYKMTTLEHLYISENSINSVSHLVKIASLIKLNTLYMSSNGIKAFPEQFWTLSTLTQLDLSYNGFTGFPAFVLNNTNLNLIDISGNTIESIPQSICSFNKLKELYAFKSSLSIFPQDLSCITAIEQLDLTSNLLTSLPPSIKSQTKLTSLLLSGNNMLRFTKSDIPASSKYTCLETCALSVKNCTSSAGCLSCSQNSLSKEICELVTESQCKWCESKSTCQFPSDTSCVYCDQYTKTSDCPSSVCKWCGDEAKCKTKSSICTFCNDSITEADCSNIGFCKYCSDSGKCSASGTNCETCATSAGCSLTNCKLCSGQCYNSRYVCNTCLSQSATCPSASCLRCNSTGDCLEKTDTSCPACHNLTSAACQGSENYPGCAYCDSQSSCIAKKDTCLPCDSYLEEGKCTSLGCHWCAVDQQCLRQSISCKSCSQLSTSLCGSRSACKWCSSSQSCAAKTGICYQCSAVSTKVCGILPGCQVNGGVCELKKEESTQPFEFSMVFIIVIVVAVVVVVLFIVIALVLKRSNAKSKQEYTVHATEMNKFEKTSFSTVDNSLSTKTVNWDDDSCPLKVDKATVNFSENGKLLSLNQQYTEAIVLKNVSKNTVDVTTVCPPINSEMILLCDCENFSLSPSASKEVKITVTVFCTKAVHSFVYFDIPSVGNVKVDVLAESENSTMLSISEIKKEKEIGEGGYGIVYKGTYRGVKVAIKELKASGLEDQTIVEEIHREIDLMQRLRSPYVVNFYGAVLTKTNTCIVMELCEGGTLAALIQKKVLPQDFKRKCAFDAARGMQFLHENKIIHRDFKPENLLVFSKNPSSSVCIKITDFGTSRVAAESNTMTTGVGTILYMAPEILNGQAYSFPSDVYSYAVSMWELFVQCTAYPGMTSQAILAMLGNGERMPLQPSQVLQLIAKSNVQTLVQPQEIPSSMQALIESCWRTNTRDRATFEDVVKALTK